MKISEQEAYEQMRADLESGECATITDSGFQTSVYFCRKYLGSIPVDFKSEAEARRALRAEMGKAQYWPNLYFVNDHGNVSQVSLRTGKAYKGREWV
jgi:hypothetical protein